MKSAKELKKKVETAIAEQLLEYGFKKKRAGCIVCQKSHCPGASVAQGCRGAFPA